MATCELFRQSLSDALLNIQLQLVAIDSVLLDLYIASYISVHHIQAGTTVHDLTLNLISRRQGYIWHKLINLNSFFKEQLLGLLYYVCSSYNIIITTDSQLYRLYIYNLYSSLSVVISRCQVHSCYVYCILIKVLNHLYSCEEVYISHSSLYIYYNCIQDSTHALLSTVACYIK